MGDTTIAERFAELSRGANRTVAARFRDVYDDIQAAIDAGVTRTKARDELALLGIDMPQNTFNSLLVRVRKERNDAKASNVQPPSEPIAQTAATTPTASTQAAKPTGWDNPSLLVKREEAELPDNWRTAELPPEVSRSLTPAQKAERTKARDQKYHPSPYDGLTDGKP